MYERGYGFLSRLTKIILSVVLVIVNYVFDAILYPGMQTELALKQADNPQVAFNGFQYLQFIHTYLWLVLLILSGLIWFKEIKSVLKKI